MKRAFVAGGSGFIGSALIRRLIADGCEVYNFDLETYAAPPGALDAVRDDPRYRHVRGDIADREAVSTSIDDCQPDVIFNLAAESHVDRSIEDPLRFVETNVLGAASLLEAATRYRRRHRPNSDVRFIHVSTDEVFGSISSGSFDDTTPYAPRSPYAASKAGADHLARAWFHTYGLQTIVTNCSNNYGPFQYPEKLIPMMTIRAIRGEPLPVYGDGSNVRDWIHVDDHVDGLLAAALRGTPGDTYLFGARNELTNLDLVRRICDLVDASMGNASGHSARRIEFVEDRPGHDARYSVDPSRTELALGWTARSTLDDGLRSTVNWYLEREDWWTSLVNAEATARRGRIDRA